MDALKMIGQNSIKPFYDSTLAMELLAEKRRANRPVTQIDWFLCGYIEGRRAERKRKADKSRTEGTMEVINEAMEKHESTCCFCGSPLEPWPGNNDCYGNNPAPADNRTGKRCCDVCNDTIVIPARLYISELIKEATE